MSTLFRREVFEHRAERLFGEVVISQSLSARYLVAAILLVVTIAIGWVSLGSYARIETAPGILVPDKPAPKIIAMAPGIVSALHVREGSIVRAGDRLAVIQLDRPTELSDGAAAESLGTVDARTALGGEQMRLSSARLLSERSKLNAAIIASEAQASDLDRQIALQTEIVGSNKAMFDQVSKVMESGFVTQVEFERRRQTLLGSQQQLSSLRQQRTSHLGQAAQARAQLASLASQNESEQAELSAAMQSLKQQRLSLESQKSYVVKAPVSGRVSAVQINIGSTANPQTPLMAIVPVDAKIRAEVYAPSRAIGFVRPGQETRLLYDAFPYQRFGSFTGHIESVSRVIIDPRETLLPVKLEEPVYKVTIGLGAQQIDAFGQKFSLQPGMALTANIVLERQSFLDWLLTPLRAVSNRA